MLIMYFCRYHTRLGKIGKAPHLLPTNETPLPTLNPIPITQSHLGLYVVLFSFVCLFVCFCLFVCLNYLNRHNRNLDILYVRVQPVYFSSSTNVGNFYKIVIVNNSLKQKGFRNGNFVYVHIHPRKQNTRAASR